MKPGDYRVQVHILECKDIKAKGKAGGGGFLANFEGETADPMVQVSFIPNIIMNSLLIYIFIWRQVEVLN